MTAMLDDKLTAFSLRAIGGRKVTTAARPQADVDKALIARNRSDGRSLPVPEAIIAWHDASIRMAQPQDEWHSLEGEKARLVSCPLAEHSRSPRQCKVCRSGRRWCPDT